jgi:ribosomal RNA-processing protein 36
VRPRREEDSEVEELENLSEDGDSSAPSEEGAGESDAGEEVEASDGSENVS